MGSNKNKKLLSKLLLTSVVVSMVIVDAVPMFSFAKDYIGDGEVTILEEEGSPETVEEPLLDLDLVEELPSSASGDTKVNEDENLDVIEEDAVEYEAKEPNTKNEKDSMGSNAETSKELTEEPKEEPIESTEQTNTNKSRVMTVQSENTYVKATDEDFSGTANGSFKYIGNKEYVEIPHTIKGVNVTSYANMFEGSRVKGVKSTNKNITNMSFMFYNYGSESLDVSLLDTSGVTDMGYMFGASNASQTELISLLGLETFDTSKVTKMNNMFTLLKVETLNLHNFNTSNVTTMFAMFRDSKASKIDVNSFDTRKVTTMSQMFMGTSSTTSLEFSNLDTSNVISMSNMFTHTGDTTLDLSNFNTSNVTDMNYMFYASHATELDLSTFDTAKVTNMSAMFRSSSAKSIDLSSFNTEKVTNMVQMFEASRVSTLDLSSFDTRNVSNMSSMFVSSSVTDITGLSGFNTERVTNMSNMFKDTVLKEIDLSGFNTVNVTNMGSMFRNTHANKLDLGNFNTSKVTSMSAMFQDARATDIEISSFDTTSVKNMGYMFHGINVEELDLSSFNTSNVTTMGYMFKNSNIKEIDTSKFDTAKVTNMRNMYEGSSVERLDLGNFNTSNVTNMSNMFKDTEASYIDVSSFNTMNVLEMVSMFQDSNATNLDLISFDTYKVTDMTNMFKGSKAKDINVSMFDTSLVTSMAGMFGNTELGTIDISSFDMSNVNNTDDMFTGTKATDGLARSREDAGKANSSKGKPETLNIRPKYVVATDEDFSGTLNGYFKYTGKESFIEVPHTIKGVKVNSYKGMFEGTSVKGVVSTNKNVTDMSNMFKGNISEELDVIGIDTTGVTNFSGMFQDTKASYLDLRNFTTTKATNMSNMFRNTRVNELDLGGFDTSKATAMENMFNGTTAIKGYARTQEDANKLNASSNKANNLHFTVWGVQTTQDSTSWTNKPVTIGVTAESEIEGINYITWVNEPSKNLVILKDLVSYSGYNTPFIYDEENYSVTTTVKSDNNLVYSSKRGLEIGDEYTQSGYMYVDGKPLTQSMVRGKSLNTSEPAITPIVVDDETGYFTQTQQNVGNSSFWMHAYGTFNLPEGSVVTLRKLKVEKGREATEWTLSPEDASLGEEPGKFTVYRNGAYVFRVVGNKGNSKEIVHTVTNIDTVNPTSELTKSTEGWTSQDVTIYVDAKDDVSGVEKIIQPDGSTVNGNKAEYKATKNGKYTFTVVDKAGNSSTYTEEVTNIDRSIPKLSADVDNTEWTRNPINIKVTTEESASGIKDISMVKSPIPNANLLKDTIFKGNIGDKHPEGWIGGSGDNGNKAELAELVKSPWESVNGLAYRISVVNDRYYIVSPSKSIVNPGDKITTSIKATGYGVQAWYNFYDKDMKEVTYDAGKMFTHVKDDVYAYTITVPKDARYYRISRIGIGTAQRISKGDVTFGNLKVEIGDNPTPWEISPEDEPIVNNTKTYKATLNGLYTFQSTYNNGLTSEVSVNVTNIDLEKPTITIKDNPTDWVESDKATLTIEAKDTLSGVSKIILPDGKEVMGNEATYQVKQNGDYEFKVVDKVGNETVHVEKVKYLMIPYKFHIYDDLGKPVSNVEFELLREGESYKRAKSNTEGLVDFGYIPPEGKYSIRQISSGGGFELSPEDIETPDVNEPIEVITYPRGKELPGTGTPFTLVFTGLTLTLGTILAYITKKKKDVKSLK